MEDCNSYVKGMKLVLKKPQDSSIVYQYWVGHQKLITKPAGLNAVWTNEHTGSGKQIGHPGHLYLWGTHLGITLHGRTLFCMKDVTITGGDADID